MDFSRINNQINPFSKGFCQATIHFDSLTKGQKIITVALSAITGLATIFLGGIGGFATFKALVDAFIAKKIPKGLNLTADQINQLRKKILNEDKKQLISQKKTYAESLSLNELLEKCPELPLPTNLPTSSSYYEEIYKETSEDQMLIIAELGTRVGQMQESEQKELLKQIKTHPKKFALVAHKVVRNSKYVASRICEFLEQCEWPSQELKEQLLPELVSFLIFAHGISVTSGFIETGENLSPLKTPGFNCTRLLIDTRMIFGRSDFTINPKPISSYLAKSVGLAIKLTANCCLLDLKKNQLTIDVAVGVAVVISQFKETRFPASMIAPILPYLKNVPGMVSLELSDIGVCHPWDPTSGKNTNGFNDEHIEVLLDIFRSQPYLQKTKINVDGMSEEKRKEFMAEWTKIWENLDRFQKPSPQKLLSLAE